MLEVYPILRDQHCPEQYLIGKRKSSSRIISNPVAKSGAKLDIALLA